MPNETGDANPDGDRVEGPGEPPVTPAGPLPDGARLLHIGQPHAGIADIERAASARREALLEHDVVYPGADLDHSAATSTLIGPASPAWQATRTLAAWDSLRAEIEAHPRARALISDEHIAACDDDTARRFVDELRSRLHVVITARNLGEVLPWLWQQRILEGNFGPFHKYLGRVIGATGRTPQAGAGLPDEFDLATQVVRWTRLVGPSSVHVVLIDEDDPAVAAGAFETMLGLPSGMLRPEQPRGDALETLPPADINLLRDVNATLKEARVRRVAYDRIVRDGAARALVATAGDRGGRQGVPPKHAKRIASEARTFVDAAGENGIDVAGAVGRFCSTPAPPVPSRPSVEQRAAMVSSLLRGAVSAALGRGVDFERAAPDPHPFGLKAPDARRGRDLLHVDLSHRRVIDFIGPSATGPDALPVLGGVAHVVASSRSARWVGVGGYALVDPELRERVFGALNDPRVIITVDADAERALWEQALALGETRAFDDWSVDGEALLATIADHTSDFSIIRSDDDDAIRQAIQDHPAPLAWTPTENGPLQRHDLLVIRELNESLAGVDLQPFERLAVIGSGAMAGMRARPARATNRPDSAARAIAGIAALVGDQQST